MQITIDIPEDSIKSLLSTVCENELSFSEQLRLLRQGENVTLERANALADWLENSFNAIVLSNDDRNIKRRKINVLIWETIDKLRDLRKVNRKEVY